MSSLKSMRAAGTGMNIKSTIRSPLHQRGAGLIEVLIAVLIMGIGLLGIAAMQATALRNSSSALERSQGVIQTYAILDSMRANRLRAIAGDYDIPRTCVAPAAPDPADDTLALSDVRLWLTSLKATLGDNDNSCGQIACDGASCEITVWWDDSRANNGAAFGSATATNVVTRTTL